MIKNSLFACVFFFLLYSAFIWTRPNITSSQNQWQDNTIKAENYIFDNSTINQVLVGSSLSCRLVMDSLPAMYNLSFGGYSLFDGLNIIRQSQKYPKHLFIETNLILRNEKEEFTKNLFSPVSYYPAKYFLSFREDKKPVPILINYLNAIRHKIAPPNIPQTKKQTTQNNQNSLGNSEKIFDQLLDMQIKYYSETPDKKLLLQKLNKLKDHIEFFKNQGVNIYFYEMPINPKLSHLALSSSIREGFYQVFPPDSNQYIIPDNTSYRTNDGIHLGRTEAGLYTSYLKSQIKKIIL